MRFWQSKACRIASGLGVLAALVLLFTTGVFDYPVSEWGAGTWLGVILIVVVLLPLCCCLVDWANRGRGEGGGK